MEKEEEKSQATSILDKENTSNNNGLPDPLNNLVENYDYHPETYYPAGIGIDTGKPYKFGDEDDDIEGYFEDKKRKQEK
jgi:hypothetical protein